MHARESGEAARSVKRERQPEKKKESLFFRASPVSRHQSRAWPFACLAFCLSLNKYSLAEIERKVDL